MRFASRKFIVRCATAALVAASTLSGGLHTVPAVGAEQVQTHSASPAMAGVITSVVADKPAQLSLQRSVKAALPRTLQLSPTYAVVYPDNLPYTPAPVGTPPCYADASESGNPVVPYTESPITAAYNQAFTFGRLELWQGESHPSIRAFEEMICANTAVHQHPLVSRFVRDGYLNYEESRYAAELNNACNGLSAEPYVKPDLLLELSGLLPCPTGMVMQPVAQPHIQAPVRFSVQVNIEIIKFVFNAKLGAVRAAEAVDVSRCEATWDNLNEHPAGEGYYLFQLMPHHANPGNAVPNAGFVWSDMTDPGNISIVSADIVAFFTHFEGVYAGWQPWLPSYSCHGHYF